MKLNKDEFNRLRSIAQTILRKKHGEPQNDTGEREIDFGLTDEGITIDAHDPEDSSEGRRLPQEILSWEELGAIFP